MALFGGRKGLVQQVLDESWQSDDERGELLQQLKESSLKVDDALKLLWHKDSGVRTIAVESLVTHADLRTARTLMDQIMEQSSSARGFGMRVFSRFPPDVVQKVVDAMLEDKKNPKKQRMGWEVVLQLSGDLGAYYQERAITEAPTVMQHVAVQKLVQTHGAARSYHVLLNSAHSSNTRVALAALQALVTVEGPEVFELMLTLMDGEDPNVQQMAKNYLNQYAQSNPELMRRSLLELLSKSDDGTRRLAIELMFQTGHPADVILDVLSFSKSLVGWLRTRILDTLQTFGDDVLRPAIELLGHNDEDIRTAVLVLVEQFNDPRLVPPLCNLLKDEDWWLRISACDSLGRLKDERAVPALVEALEDADVRWSAIGALAQIGSSNAIKPLAQLLRDPRLEVRREVVRAFGSFTEKRLLPLLKRLTTVDPSSEVRTLAAEVMRDMSRRLNIAEEDLEKGTMAVTSDSLDKAIDRLLSRIREEGASDLHISVDDTPFYRIGGELVRVPETEKLSQEEARNYVLDTLTNRQKERLMKAGELDYCYAIPEVGRYRANAYVQRLGLCATFRVIPNLPPNFVDLRIPSNLAELLDYHQGMIVVSGPAASGKSTTLAAIVNLINESKASHVVTLEDPIEFVHPSKTALVNQRELDTHTVSFARALRGALRQDPDIIMVGEMRDPETIRMALEASETGHLVIATLHTTSAVATIERLISSFPPSEQGQIRMALSESLKYVVCQSLLPRKDGSGRVAVFEVLKNTFNIGNLIREGKNQLIPSLMQIGRNVGMQTVDMALMDLVSSGMIAAEQAWLRAEKQETFEPMCNPAFLREAKAFA
ncbi:MAG: PilT/PilU family type 4a pilus ATPase [Deltaproteobacteria bacterium]|nr:MAG: PilT/PilU family type 4a pilus ATPase [Deltaproteobacteria bacterium]